MNEWLAGLEVRERRMVIGGALAVTCLVLYALILEPMLTAYSQRSEQLSAQRATLAWMQQAAAEIGQSGAAAGQGNGLGDRSLLAVVDGSARSAGLGDAMKRVKPEGSRGVRVWFEGVAFDDLVTWLGQLAQQHQVSASLVTVERQEQSGRVHAQLTLESVD